MLEASETKWWKRGIFLKKAQNRREKLSKRNRENKKNQNRREGCLFTIACKQCKKESQVFGWMIGCDCQTCKDQSIGAAK